jgi:N-acetylglucosaminyldiphosphoundecaprenol N-acetyl-beta-D-mannosaminyltransferase
LVPIELMYVAGLPIWNAGLGRVLAALRDDAVERRPRVYVFVNGFSATLARQAAYRDALLSSETVPLVDGFSLVLGALLSGQGRIARCPGPDLMEAAAAAAASDGTSFFLLGGGPGVVEALEEALTTRHPALRIAGAFTPPFTDWDTDESCAMCAAIRRSEADVVWLGVSAPKQEAWACTWHAEIGRPVVCVGAAFDFLSGSKPRAPRWMRAGGIEWLFRLFSEPRRVWRRYLVGNGVFLLDLLRYGARRVR